MKVNIAQILLTIQCEQQSLGTPVILLRFQGCNLRCPWCDTKYANVAIPYSFDENDLIRILKPYSNVTDVLLITGGEPFLQFNRVSFFNKLSVLFNTFIIETNGMGKIEYYTPEYLSELFCGKTYHLNVSFKLELECYKKSISKIELQSLISEYISVIRKNNSYIFKMVYHENIEDDIIDFIVLNNIRKEEIFIMPLTPIEYINTTEFFERYRENCIRTIEFCIRNKLNYSPREHIFLYHKRPSEQFEIFNILQQEG